jgi:hypothetical protein
MQIAQMHQDADYGEDHVRQYLKQVLTDMVKQIQGISAVEKTA